MKQKDKRLSGLLDLGIRVWDIVDGVYGFIDVDTGFPLQDDLLRNFDFFRSNLIPHEFQDEFKRWQEIQPDLDKKIWKIFWGNFFNFKHITILGDIAEMRRQNPFRRLEELEAIAYDKAIEKLLIKSEHLHEIRDLAKGGRLLTLSPSPLDWEDDKVQQRKKAIQELFKYVTLSST
jgi:hypothetical protein